MIRLLALFAPVRWLKTLRELMGGARLSPNAFLFGRRSQIRLGKGSKVGARCRLDSGSRGLIEIGERVWVSTDVEIQTQSAVRIGPGTTIQRRCTINGSTRVGEGCIFAPDVFVSSGTHAFLYVPHLPLRAQERLLAADDVAAAALDRPVWIQDDCWLGAHVVVAPGVTIGKGSVIGANAVVTRDVRPYSVMAGVPARRIGARLDWVPPKVLDPKRLEDAPYILNGRVVRDQVASPYIRVDGRVPLLAALAADENILGVALQYETIGPAKVNVGSRTLTLAAGKSRIEIGRDDVTVRDGVAYVDMELNSPLQPEVRIYLLESV